VEEAPELEINIFLAARMADGTGPGGVVVDCCARPTNGEQRAKKITNLDPKLMGLKGSTS
jgi:hypothetical protein